MAHTTIADNTMKAISKLEELKAAGLRASNASSTFFGKLPPEIRNIIYSRVLVRSQPISPGDGKVEALTSILRSCAQIRQEATLIFFSANSFHIEIDVASVESSLSLRWLRSIGTKNAARLENAVICLRDSEVDHYINNLGTATVAGFLGKLSAISQPTIEVTARLAETVLSCGTPKTKVCSRCAPTPKDLPQNPGEEDAELMIRAVSYQNLKEGYTRAVL